MQRRGPRWRRRAAYSYANPSAGRGAEQASTQWCWSQRVWAGRRPQLPGARPRPHLQGGASGGIWEGLEKKGGAWRGWEQ